MDFGVLCVWVRLMTSVAAWMVEVVNRSGRRSPSAIIRKGIEAVMSQHHGRRGVVSILLTEDLEMADLNERFRRIKEPTDVLTFPSEFPGVLGDIAISVPYAERQAKARGVSLSQEIGYLAIHGGLHLLGFDDETEEDRVAMVEQMNRAAVAAGLKPDREWASILHGDHE
jgi:probable rRNA maturation factor